MTDFETGKQKAHNDHLGKAALKDYEARMAAVAAKHFGKRGNVLVVGEGMYSCGMCYKEGHARAIYWAAGGWLHE